MSEPTDTNTDSDTDADTNEQGVDVAAFIEGDVDDDVAAAWNEDIEQRLDDRLDERLADLAADEQAAVEALLEEADETAETETVDFPSGLELDVRTRFPPGVEHQLERLERLEERDAPTREIARVNCRLLAEMCETDGYDSADVWLTAWEQRGLQWLSEMTAEVTAPAAREADELGNRFGR